MSGRYSALIKVSSKSGSSGIAAITTLEPSKKKIMVAIKAQPFLLTGPGIERPLEILTSLVILKIVIENKDICEPIVLTTPRMEQEELINQSSCFKQKLLPK